LALCALTSADASRAAREGAALAGSLRSYSVRPWVLWDRKDPLRAEHGRADLDAVIVETPYEHVRYDGYMQRLQGLPLGSAQISRFRRDADGRYGFIVYAHSQTDDRAEAAFLKKFSNATVQPANGATLSATERAYVGPTSDFYDVGTFREERYTGSLTYRFPAPPPGCARTGVLRFRDGRGRAYRFSFDLSRKMGRPYRKLARSAWRTLVRALSEAPTLPAALAAYERERVAFSDLVIVHALYVGAYVKAQVLTEEERAMTERYRDTDRVLRETAVPSDALVAAAAHP
jgi:hypothetical protein